MMGQLNMIIYDFHCNTCTMQHPTMIGLSQSLGTFLHPMHIQRQTNVLIIYNIYKRRQVLVVDTFLGTARQVD